MPDHNHISEILESILQELCHQHTDNRSFSILYQEELKALSVEDFPTDLQSKYKQLMNQLDQVFEVRMSPEDPEDPKNSPRKSPASLIKDLIHLYARLQTHKTPYVNKRQFLDRLNDTAPVSTPAPTPSERKTLP